MPPINRTAPNLDTSGSSPEDYTWDDAAQDIDLIPAIHRYAKNVDNKVFHDDAEALDWFKHDRRWKDANTISALGELNRVSGGWGTAKASKEDLQDLATIRNRWERLPGGFERIAQGDIAGGVGAIVENVGKGLLDPTIAVGGIAGKAVGSKLAKVGIGMGIDAAVTAGANAIYQETNKQVGLQDEIDPWSVVTSGALGAGISAPGHVINAGHSAPKLDIKKAAEQAISGAEDLKAKGYTNLYTDRERLKNLGLPPEVTPEEVAKAPQEVQVKLSDPKSLEHTLASKWGIPLPKVQQQAKSIQDFVSGKLIHINATEDTENLIQQFAGWEEHHEMFTGARTGRQSMADIEAAADVGLKGKSVEGAAKDVINLPKGYNPNAPESIAVSKVRAALWNIAMDDSNEEKAARALDVYWDLTTKDIAMGSEAGRALVSRRYRKYAPMTPSGVLGKAAAKASKVINTATGNTSPYAVDKDSIHAIRDAIKSFTDPKTGVLDPLKADVFLANLDNQKAKPGDALWEAWYNGLLSNPSTMAINTIGNSVVTGMHLTENMIGDALSGVGPKTLLAGYMKAIPDSLKAFYKTFTTEMSVDSANRHEGYIGQAIPSFVWDKGLKDRFFKFRTAGVGEAGAWGGKQVRLPGRVLMATDDMSKIQHYGGAIASSAIEETLAKGIKPGTKAFNDSIAELTAKPTPKMQEYANDMMHRLTFTNSDRTATAISQFIESVPGGRLIVPFVRTPWNIAKYTADMLSVPGLAATKRTKEDFAAGGVRANRAKARLMMGYGILSGGIWAATSGLTTAGGPSDPQESASWAANNLPWAVKIGNTQVQWNRLDPIAMPLALGAGSVDLVKAINDPEREDAFYVTAAKLFGDAVLDKTWFEGVQNVINAVTDPERYGGNLGNNIARTFVPSVVAGSIRAWDPRVTAPQTLMEVMQDRIGYDRGKIPAKQDVFGREQSFESLGGSKENTGITGVAARLAVPFRVKTDTNDPVASEISDLRIKLQMPPKKWNGVELTAAQFAVYNKARGQYLYDGVKYAMQSPEWKSLDAGVRRSIVDILKTEASMVADVTLSGVYPELVRQKYSPDNNKLMKKFTLPTQKEIDAKTTKPFGNPKLQGKEVTDRSATSQDTDPETFSETLGLTFKKNKKPVMEEGERFADKYSGKLTDMLSNLSKNSANASYRELASSILDKAPDLTIGVKESQDGFTLLGKTGSDPNTNEPLKLKLYHATGDKKSDGFNEETALHEALHATLRQALFTDKGINDSPEYNELAKLRRDIQSYHGPFNRGNEPKELWYTEAMDNTSEFLSYAMTNKNFQDYLKNNTRTLYKDGTSGWDVFKDIVKSVIGLDSDSSIKETDLDRVLRASKSLIGKFPKIGDKKTSSTDENKPLTTNKLSGILSASGLEIVNSKNEGVSYDPLTHTITRGPNVSDDTISKLVKGRSAEWKNQSIKVKLEDGSTVDVPAHKVASIMKSKLSKARKLLEEYSSEA